MKFTAIIFLITACILILSKSLHSQAPDKHNDLTQYVNPFIGTAAHGHTFPGATLPFGMMQLSPDTRLSGWDGCSGYHYSDEYIYGFSHTHLSGTGVSDYADILLMPTNEKVFYNGADTTGGYKARFSHRNEKAGPGYYSVFLDQKKIKVDLTVSHRSGIHSYQYPENSEQYVILDLEHRDQLLNHKIEVINDTTIQGYRFSNAWASDQRVFYYISFSEPLEEVSYFPVNSKNPTKAAIKFKNNENNPLFVKIGISPVDINGARNNLLSEIGNKSFEDVHTSARESWQKQLSKIIIEEDNADEKTTFYTALYHSMIAPNLYSDIDGRYRGMDKKIYHTDSFNYYTVFSLWDTYRAAHPLYTIIEQERTEDFIHTMLSKYDEGGIIPIWDLSACYTGCMIGYHGIPVIADAYMKGIRNYDNDKALEAMVHSADREHLGLKSYKKYGFIPIENESESVSKTLEYAYDDWSIARMAMEMGRDTIYERFIQRAQYYMNQFDPKTKFMRGRFRNTWFTPFDPYEVNFNFTEANSWQYSSYVPQDITGLIDLHGGKTQFGKHLDEVFTARMETSGHALKDITGLIGQYAHGNEPSHHMAYLYNFINRPSESQKRVNQIVTELYSNSPEGISGNEDCGQMSAWYIFSTLGFYPVTPGSNEYIIGTPHFRKAVIHLENREKFTVRAKNFKPGNIYIQSASLNGKNHPYSYITHNQIISGGTLEFTMSNQPSDWATDDAYIPSTTISDQEITPLPYIQSGELTFNESTEVSLSSVDEKSTIYYSMNDGIFDKYTSPIHLHKATKLTVYGEKNGVKSAQFTTEFKPKNKNLSLSLSSEYDNQYNGGGKNALIDAVKGGTDFRTGMWQGFHNRDLVAKVNLYKKTHVDSIRIGFLEDQGSWIFLPKKVRIEVSENGSDYTLLRETNLNTLEPGRDAEIMRVSTQINKEIKSLRITAKTVGELPKWHIGHEHEGKAWIFADEIELIYDN